MPSPSATKISPETLIFFFPQQMKAIQIFLPFKPLKQFFQESCGRSRGAAGELPAPRSPLGIPKADSAQSEGSAGITRHQHQEPGQEMQALPLITSSLVLLGALCEENLTMSPFQALTSHRTTGRMANPKAGMESTSLYGPLGSPPAQHLLRSV